MGWFDDQGKCKQPPPARLMKDDLDDAEVRDAEDTLLSTHSRGPVYRLRKAFLVALSITRLRLPKPSLESCNKAELTDMLMQWVRFTYL